MRLTRIKMPTGWADQSRFDAGGPHEAWVCFSGDTELWWLHVLKKGFRHCFVIVRDAAHWLAIDPLSPHLEVAVLPITHAFDLPHWLQTQNMTVVRAPIRRDLRKPAPLFLCSCVEVIKRFLGIHNRRIITPYQLYRFLQQQKKPSLPTL